VRRRWKRRQEEVVEANPFFDATANYNEDGKDNYGKDNDGSGGGIPA
jgi:hypothetical protein